MDKEAVSRKVILDACCGSRMFWFDPLSEKGAVFMDKRQETHSLTDSSSMGGSRVLHINPDMVGDFTALPFDAESFPLVIFDPPHLIRQGKNSWLAKKYGKLGKDWREEIRLGFAGGFRSVEVLPSADRQRDSRLAGCRSANAR